jgi:hypothetical protein
MTPLCRLARIHGRLGWKASPLTLGDLVSNLVSMAKASHSVVDSQKWLLLFHVNQE